MMERSTSKITLAESVYERIRRDIITNQLKPGEKINIRELSTRYEASETPIRLALNRLASENIIEHFPRQGMRVKSLNINLCEETFDLRLMLESYYIQTMVAQGVISGYTDGSFKPQANITRGQMAKILYNLM